MNSERERQITSIFHSALEREASERSAYLDHACEGNDDLRREVEMLIESHERAGSFIDAPACERGAELLDERQHTGSLVGRRFGQYRLVSLIGAGGMGEVYLAEDTRLDRRVAIKVLPSHLTADHAQVGRFQQEARAASALNHPNIITVYDINESEGTQYIATEYIEGATLRARLGGGALTIHETLEIAVQVAGALSAAHGAGVVHRDIKPENVMVRPDGYVKVLDFGIAKLTEKWRSSVDDEAPTRALVETGKGVVMGTAHYMSPEQARGASVDARTDIWSLGVVLYEMVSGRLPFEGETVSDCIASILKMDPPPLTKIARDFPARLDWIVQKALRKDADERYQTAKEILSDLRAVRQEAEALAQLERSVPQSAMARAGTPPDGSGSQTEAATTDPDASAPTNPVKRTISSAEYIITEIRRQKWGSAVALAALVIIIASVGFVFYRYARQTKIAPALFEKVQVSRITTSGRADEADISPDGKYVVFLEMAEDGNRSLQVLQTASGNVLTIVPPTKGNVLKEMSFSPDGNFVYHTFWDRVNPNGLYRVPSIGGVPKKVIANCDSHAAVSPDGSRIAFMRSGKLLVANVDGTGERVVATSNDSEWFSDAGAPAWSPDGRTIACTTGLAPSEEFRLLGFDAQTGAKAELSPQRWSNAGRVVWMPDGAALVLLAMERVEEGRFQVWRVSYPGGEASRITNDVHGYSESSLGVTADGQTLVTVTRQTRSRIETIPASGDIRRIARLTTSDANEEGFYGFAWTPDKRIVYSSFEGSQSDIWIMNSDGSQRHRPTSDAYLDGYPSVSPDGRYVVFASNRPNGGGVFYIWRMDIDGSNLTRLTAHWGFGTDISPDGSWVIYFSYEGPSLRRVSMDGGESVRIAAAS